MPVVDQRSRTASHALDLSINAAIGAVTAGLRAHRDSRPFWRAAAQGAAGGAVTYAGKRIIGTGEPSLRLLGRETAAVGASMVRNAGDGRGVLASAVLPLGPVRFHVNDGNGGGDSKRVRVKLDVAGSVAMMYMATRTGSRFDLGTSLTAGTPVFTGHGSENPYHIAEHGAGVIAVATGISAERRRQAVTHELIHAVQYDANSIAWGEPAERALLQSVSGGAWLNRHLDIGLSLIATTFADQFIPYRERPWEREARLMTGQR